MMDTFDGSIVTVEETAKYFPNLANLHPDTKIQAWREFRTMRDVMELTIFYREPNEEKKRLDAEIEGKVISEGRKITPADIKILSLGAVVTAII